MNNERIVFSQILDFIPKHQFRTCVNRYSGNYRVKSFSCFDQYLIAVAYAADGRLDEAIKTAQKALSLALSANQKPLADEIQSHLEIYKSKLAKKP